MMAVADRLLDELVTRWREVDVARRDRRVVVVPGAVADAFRVVVPFPSTAPAAWRQLWTATVPDRPVRGTTLREIAARHGATVDASVAAGSAVVTGTCPPGLLGPVLSSVREAVTTTGAAPEAVRDAARELAYAAALRWAQVDHRAAGVAALVLHDRGVALPHPGLPAELASVDLHAHRCTDPGWLVLSAAVTDDVEWPAAAPPDLPRPAPAPPRRVAVPADAGPDRAAVVLAASLAPPDEPEHWAAAIGGALLGGFITSRLWERLRHSEQLSYSPRAAVAFTAYGSHVQASAGTTGARLPAVLAAVRHELELLTRHDVDEDELTRARRSLVGGLVRATSGAARRFDLVTEWLARGVAPDVLHSFAGLVAATPSVEVLREVRQRLDPAHLTVVVAHPGAGQPDGIIDRAFGGTT